MGFQKHHIPWNKDLTIIDPRVRKTIENRRVTVLQKYGTLYLGGRPKKGTIPWNRGLTKTTNLTVQEYAKKLKEYWLKNKRTPWNKGLTKEVDERVKAIAIKKLGKKMSDKTKRKLAEKARKRRLSEDTKRKLSQIRKGRRLSAEHKKNISRALKNKPKLLAVRQHLKEIFSQPRYKQKQSEIHKALWKKPSYREKVVKSALESMHIRPNKKEVLLANVLQNVVPREYKYVGDGSLIIGGCCPDFMNVNGKKKLIELYGDYWHRNDEPQDRITYFKQFGFETLIVWEHELDDTDSLTKKIVAFNEIEGDAKNDVVGLPKM